MATEPTKTVTPSTMTARRKRRWGDAVSTEENDFYASAPLTAADDDNNNNSATAVVNADANVNGNALPPPTSATTHPTPLVAAASGSDAMARAAALQASIRERLAALKARTAYTTSTATVGAAGASMTPTTPVVATTTHANDDINASQHKHKRAKIFELDMSSTASTRLLERRQRREERLRSASGSTVAEKHRVEGDSNSSQPKENNNPYLAHIVTSSDLNDGGKKKKKKDALIMQKAIQEDELQLLDTRLSAPQKSRPKSRPIHFVEPGTYIALGEKKRFIASKAEESGYISGRKVGNVVKSVGMGGGGDTTAIEAVYIDDNTAGRESYYGSSEAGGKSIIEQRLPPRHDAPEIELEEFTTKKRILTSVSDVNVEQNEDAILNAVKNVMSSMPYAVEWWDAELLPSKLRKELAGEEGKAIASQTRKQQSLGSKSATTSTAATSNAATNTPGGDAMVEDDKATCSDRNQTSAAVAQFHSQNERQKELIAKCYKMASISHSKTHSLIQHPVPILTPAQLAAKEVLKNKPPTLHLTKAEQKRHRKLRRAERLREQQDLQAAGLIPPPEPRLTLSNYMKVLGDQAVIDPSKMEAVVMNQIQGRKLKHDQMNAERKLTKEQKAAKHAKKLQEDTSQSVYVALFYVKDMSHPYHRTKVDLNAQQNGITGGVLECNDATSTNGNCASSSMALVIAEGGEKALKRYVRLMTVRMRWKGEDFYEHDDDEVDDDDDDDDHEELLVGDDDKDGDGTVEGGEGDTTIKKKNKDRKKFNPNNACELIWSGMALKRAFHTFMFQRAESTIVARKILEAKGVAHYWDLALGHVNIK